MAERRPSGIETRPGDGIGDVERIEQEVARGDTARTPVFVLTSVALMVAVLFAIALAIVVLAWLLA